MVLPPLQVPVNRRSHQSYPPDLALLRQASPKGSHVVLNRSIPLTTCVCGWVDGWL